MILLKDDKFEWVILLKTDIKYTIFKKNEVNYANDTFMITMQVDFVYSSSNWKHYKVIARFTFIATLKY